MTETTSTSPPLRRLGDEPASTRHRIGVLWCADATTARHKIWSTVLDISPEGAKLKVDTNLLGHIERFRLEVESLGPIECAPVWQHDDHLGVRFLDGHPSMTQLEKVLSHPPYRSVAA
jgi:hypothetical protein